MPIFNEGGGDSVDNYEIPNQTRLPKEFMVAGHNQNEKFLNDWQSTIEDHADGNLKAKFIDYQNDQFTPNAELSSNHKESFFKCIPRKLFSPIQPLVTFSNATLNRGPKPCTEYGSEIAMSDDGWINKSANTATMVVFSSVGDKCYTHQAWKTKDAPSAGQVAFYDSSFAMEGTAVSYVVGAPTWTYVSVSTGSRDDDGIRCAYYSGSTSNAFRYQSGNGSVLSSKFKTTSYTSLQASFSGGSSEGNPITCKVKGVAP